MKLKCNQLLNDLPQNLTSALDTTFSAVLPQLLPVTREIDQDNSERGLLENVVSHVVYPIIRNHIDGTNRQQAERMSEYVPNWLMKSMPLSPDLGGNLCSCFAKHLLTKTHKDDLIFSFKPL